MKWMQLITNLEQQINCIAHITKLTDNRLSCVGCQLLSYSISVREIQGDYLFVGRISELPADPKDLPANCICIADSPLPDRYLPSAYNLVLLEYESSDSALLALFHHISYYLAEPHRRRVLAERIKTPHAADYSTQQLIEMAESVFECPLFVTSRWGDLLGSSAPEAFSVEWLSTALQSPALTQGDLRQLSEESLHLEIDRISTYAGHSGAQLLCFDIITNGLFSAQLIVQATVVQLQSIPAEFLRHVYQRLTTTVGRWVHSTADRSLLHTMLFESLVHASPDQLPILRSQIRDLNWRECAGMQLYYCRPIRFIDSEGVDHLRQVLPGARWTFVDLKILLLCYPPDSLQEARDMVSILEAHGLRAGVSWSFDELDYLPYAFHQARTALEMGHGTLTSYSECFLTDIAMLPFDESVRHIHPSIRILADYDKGNNTDLLRTLEVCLTGPESKDELAAALFISRSTLFYRLNRIRELTGQALSTGLERANLLASLRLYKYAQKNGN